MRHISYIIMGILILLTGCNWTGYISSSLTGWDLSPCLNSTCGFNTCWDLYQNNETKFPSIWEWIAAETP